MLEFVGLRAKMYSMVTEERKEKKTAKGVKRSVLAKEIKHEDYKTCLFTKQECEHKMVILGTGIAQEPMVIGETKYQEKNQGKTLKDLALFKLIF